MKIEFDVNKLKNDLVDNFLKRILDNEFNITLGQYKSLKLFLNNTSDEVLKNIGTYLISIDTEGEK